MKLSVLPAGEALQVSSPLAARCSESSPAHLPNLISQRPPVQAFPPADWASSQPSTHACSTCCDPHLTCYSPPPPREDLVKTPA